MAVQFRDPYSQFRPVDVGGFTPTTGEYLGKRAAETWDTNPTVSLRAFIKQRRAEYGYGDGKTISREEAQARLTQAGKGDRLINIPGDQIPEDFVSWHEQNGYEERIRARVFENAQTSLGTEVAAFGLGFVVSMADPLNIAASMVPPLRAGMAASTAGRALERLGAGFVEAGVATVALEPIIYAGQSAMGRDYGMADSLLNFTFGGILGGGLHMGAGALKDRHARILKQRTDELRRAIDEGNPVRERAIREQAVRDAMVTSQPAGLTAHRISALSPEDRSAAITIARAQLMKGDVNIEPYIRLVEMQQSVAEVADVKLQNFISERIRVAETWLKDRTGKSKGDPELEAQVAFLENNRTEAVKKRKQELVDKGVPARKAKKMAEEQVADRARALRQELDDLKVSRGTKAEKVGAMRQELAMLKKGEIPPRLKPLAPRPDVPEVPGGTAPVGSRSMPTKTAVSRDMQAALEDVYKAEQRQAFGLLYNESTDSVTPKMQIEEQQAALPSSDEVTNIESDIKQLADEGGIIETQEMVELSAEAEMLRTLQERKGKLLSVLDCYAKVAA